MEIIHQWIETAANHKIKIGDRILSSEECDLIILVLQSIAAEMELYGR